MGPKTVPVVSYQRLRRGTWERVRFHFRSLPR